MGTKMQKLTDSSASALGAALFAAALHGARAAACVPVDLTMCAAQGALRALLELELGEAADRAAYAITSAARSRIGLAPEDKNKRVLLDLLGRVNWRHQRPLTLALVIGTAAHGSFVVWLDSPDGEPLRYERLGEETAPACAERLRAETLGTIGEAVAA